MSDECKTKYPIFMVHGMGFKDSKLVGYWGRIPEELKKRGAEVYFGNQDSHASIESNAETIKQSLLDVIKETGAEKVNIIAHSKGGLEARYMISSMGMADKVASLSTMSTPHNGSATVDKLLRLSSIVPGFVFRAVFKSIDLWARFMGDKKPDTLRAVQQFTTEEARQFNRQNPNADGIYYQSFAFVMKNAFADMFMFWTYLLVKICEKEKSDGLLTPISVIWTNFKGVYTGAGRRGISHCDEVDMRRHRLSKKQGGENTVSDITAFYINVVKKLKEMGY